MSAALDVTAKYLPFTPPAVRVVGYSETKDPRPGDTGDTVGVVMEVSVVCPYCGNLHHHGHLDGRAHNPGFRAAECCEAIYRVEW